jgi:MarR family transcriptional regulator, lower aerobic nicotinate degradation pathway regulator
MCTSTWQSRSSVRSADAPITVRRTLKAVRAGSRRICEGGFLGRRLSARDGRRVGYLGAESAIMTASGQKRQFVSIPGAIAGISPVFRGFGQAPLHSLDIVKDRELPAVASGLHDEEIYGKPGHLIRRLQQIAVAIFVAETKSFDITPVQYASLLAVQLHPGIDQTALTDVIAFDLSTIGEVVGRLESKGLVKRLISPKDRRAKALHITAAGRRLLAQMKPGVEAAQERILAPLPKAERAAFVRALKHVVEANNEHSRVPLRRRARAEPASGADRKKRQRRQS